MKDIEPLVTPSEAVDLFEMASGGVFFAAQDVADAYIAAQERDGQDTIELLCLIACVWNAGRIQGVREERRNRKEQNIAEAMHQKPIGRVPIGGGRTVPLFDLRPSYINTSEGWKLYGAYLDAKRAYEDGKRAFEDRKVGRRRQTLND